MNRLYLVRHGENVANLTKEFSHRLVDHSLTQKGVDQAQQAAAYFQDKAIDAVFSSPLKRAAETAQIIAAACDRPVVKMENFRELNVGDLEGQPPSAQTWGVHREVVQAWMAGDLARSFPGGENYWQLLVRYQAGLESILAGRDDQNIVIVAHGGIFVFTLPRLCPNVSSDWLRNQPNENANITELLVTRQDGRLIGDLVRWASTDHLSGSAADFVPGVPDAEMIRRWQKESDG